jgi:hypothetical protein
MTNAQLEYHQLMTCILDLSTRCIELGHDHIAGDLRAIIMADKLNIRLEFADAMALFIKVASPGMGLVTTTKPRADEPTGEAGVDGTTS